MFTIIRNLFINKYRATVRSAVVIDRSDDLYHLNLSQESGFETPEGALSTIEINAAINRFSDDYRVPFSMFIAGYKYAEIAEHMTLPLGTVKSRIFLARQKLKSALADYRYD